MAPRSGRMYSEVLCLAVLRCIPQHHLTGGQSHLSCQSWCAGYFVFYRILQACFEQLK